MPLDVSRESGVITMVEPCQIDADIDCDVCGASTRVPGHGSQHGILQAVWGDGSEHDGERYRVHLCESCFFQTLAFLRQERRINTLFDDASSTDEQAFGRVARDD